MLVVNRQFTPENEALNSLAGERYNSVMNTYNGQQMFKIATAGKSSTYANDLIDSALSLCGSPYYAQKKVYQSKKVRNFLSLFRSFITLEVRLKAEGSTRTWEERKPEQINIAQFSNRLISETLKELYATREGIVELRWNYLGSSQGYYVDLVTYRECVKWLNSLA